MGNCSKKVTGVYVVGFGASGIGVLRTVLTVFTRDAIVERGFDALDHFGEIPVLAVTLTGPTLDCCGVITNLRD